MPVRAKRLDLIPPYLFGEIARLKAAARAEGKDLILTSQPQPQSSIVSTRKQRILRRTATMNPMLAIQSF